MNDQVRIHTAFGIWFSYMFHIDLYIINSWNPQHFSIMLYELTRSFSLSTPAKRGEYLLFLPLSMSQWSNYVEGARTHTQQNIWVECDFTKPARNVEGETTKRGGENYIHYLLIHILPKCSFCVYVSACCSQCADTRMPTSCTFLAPKINNKKNETDLEQTFNEIWFCWMVWWYTIWKKDSSTSSYPYNSEEIVCCLFDSIIFALSLSRLFRSSPLSFWCSLYFVADRTNCFRFIRNRTRFLTQHNNCTKM